MLLFPNTFTFRSSFSQAKRCICGVGWLEVISHPRQCRHHLTAYLYFHLCTPQLNLRQLPYSRVLFYLTEHWSVMKGSKPKKDKSKSQSLQTEGVPTRASSESSLLNIRGSKSLGGFLSPRSKKTASDMYLKRVYLKKCQKLLLFQSLREK